MPLRPFEIVDFGGVDSRSNPVNMPANRMLRCLNWVPKQDGHLELRYGYSVQGTTGGAAINSLLNYQMWGGTSYLIVGESNQSTTNAVYTFNLSNNALSSPSFVSPAASPTTNARFRGYSSQNRLYFGNGVSHYWYDGSSLIRQNGIRALTASEVSGVVITAGVRELSSTEASTATVTAAAGGTFPATTGTGFLFYVAIFDTSLNELGPSTISIASRKTCTLNQKFTVASLPDLSATNTNWVKLVGRTGDGDGSAYFCTNTSTSITISALGGGTTFLATGHGLSTGDVVVLSGFTNDSNNGVFAVSAVGDANHFSIATTLVSEVTTATVKRIVKAGNAVTSVDVTAPDRDTSWLVNQDRGLAPTSVGGSGPGYQFYASIYNAVAGQHVGNRIAIGTRYAPSTRANVRISGLSSAVSVYGTEGLILIGRTGDGAQVPYVITDSAGNYITTATNSDTSLTITESGIDGDHELPTRNGVIPSECTMFARVGDFIWAADPSSPTLRRAGSELLQRSGQFLGDPAQSWSPNDIETFPTTQAVTGIGEVDYELFVGTKSDCAILTEVSGTFQWKGPWNVGLAGPDAMCKASPYGFFWLSHDKQLCTFSNGLPIPISEEYEAAELNQIGDAYISTVQIVHYRNAKQGKDELRIEGQKSNGTPITIIHDFKLRDARSPLGQGYSAQFLGALSSYFAVTQARDSNGKTQVYAGASSGTIYKLYSGVDDNATEFTADGLFLRNGGTDRPDLPFIDWYGDSRVTVSVGKTLSSDVNSAVEGFEVLSTETVPGPQGNPLYRAKLTAPEMLGKMYIRFQLTSQSTGSLDLNDPPHCPLETYGRIWEVIPIMGEARGV